MDTQEMIELPCAFGLGYCVAAWARNRDRSASYLIRLELTNRSEIRPGEAYSIDVVVRGRKYFSNSQWLPFVAPWTMFPHRRVAAVWRIPSRP